MLTPHAVQVLYKKLLKQAVGLHDLEEMQPILGRSLKQLLQYEGEPGSVEAVFCQTFAVDIEAFGEVRSVELKAGGSDVPVTEDNRREFVELYTEYILVMRAARPLYTPLQQSAAGGICYYLLSTNSMIRFAKSLMHARKQAVGSRYSIVSCPPQRERPQV